MSEELEKLREAAEKAADFPKERAEQVAKEYAEWVAKEDAVKAAKDHAKEVAREQAEKAAEKRVDEAIKEAYMEAWDEATRDAYEEAWDDAYKEAYDEAYEKAYAEAMNQTQAKPDRRTAGTHGTRHRPHDGFDVRDGKLTRDHEGQHEALERRLGNLQPADHDGDHQRRPGGVPRAEGGEIMTTNEESKSGFPIDEESWRRILEHALRYALFAGKVYGLEAAHKHALEELKAVDADATVGTDAYKKVFDVKFIEVCKKKIPETYKEKIKEGLREELAKYWVNIHMPEGASAEFGKHLEESAQDWAAENVDKLLDATEISKDIDAMRLGEGDISDLLRFAHGMMGKS